MCSLAQACACQPEGSLDPSHIWAASFSRASCSALASSACRGRRKIVQLSKTPCKTTPGCQAHSFHSTGMNCKIPVLVLGVLKEPPRLNQASYSQPASQPASQAFPEPTLRSCLPSAAASGGGTALPTCRCLLCTLP